MDKIADARQFAGLMGALASCFGREADAAFLMGYELGLQDLPIADISAAVSRAITTGKFMPTVAELREYAGVLAPQARAVKAWEALAEASLNPYHSVDFDDPVINATVRNIGGWQYVCSIDDRKEFEVFLRQKFEKVYVALYQSGISSEQCRPLVGLFDESNGVHGYGVKEPLRITTGLPTPAVRISKSEDRTPIGIGELKRIGQ